MRCITGVFFVFLIFSLAPAAAQSPQYRRPMPAREECPQGRQIREQQGFYPSTMTDCQLLDADTAVENQKLKRKLLPKSGEPVPAPAALAIPVAAPQAATIPGRSTENFPVAAAAPLRADYEQRVVGNWITSAKEDRFGDGGTFVAITGEGDVGLAVRCLQKNLSIGVLEIGDDPKPIEKGDLFKFKFRVDAQPVIEAAGMAISDRLIQVETEKATVKAIRDGRETAMRIEDSRGVTSTHIFDTTGARRAFADLSRECPID
jgi:hypothetical protein